MNGKVLILGRTGMLGHMALSVLRAAGLGVDGTLVDNRDPRWHFDVEEGMERLAGIYDAAGSYEYVINCIGILAERINTQHPDSIKRSIAINAIFPHQLAQFAADRQSRVIHISTDGVFYGNGGPYREDSPHDCADLYGITKSIGEVRDRANVINLRCSIIGPSPYEGSGLLEWFLNRADGSTVTGYTDHIWHGVSTYQLAQLCRAIITRGVFDELRRESSVFHFAPNRPVSKYGLLCLFRDHFHKSVHVAPAPCPSGGTSRILNTQYRSLAALHDTGLPPDHMVSELAEYLNSN